MQILNWYPPQPLLDNLQLKQWNTFYYIPEKWPQLKFVIIKIFHMIQPLITNITNR